MGTVQTGIRCALCGSGAPGRYRQSSLGDAFCLHHPWCARCATAHSSDASCPERALVVSSRDAVDRTARVLADLRALELSLPPVPSTLVPNLPGPEEGRCLKISGTAGRSARIEIEAGLGPTRFGHVVAHEHTHALLHLHGGPHVDPAVEEGVCELVAVVWLTSRSTSPEILNNVWANPHPVYGAQLRRLVRLARRDGVRTVIDRALRTGRPE